MTQTNASSSWRRHPVDQSERDVYKRDATETLPVPLQVNASHATHRTAQLSLIIEQLAVLVCVCCNFAIPPYILNV